MSERKINVNRAVWFDIPVADLDRAAAFYRAVLAIEVTKETTEGFSFCVLQHHPDGDGGCLFVEPEAIRGEGGVLLYLNVDGRLRAALDEVVKHGGTVIGAVHALGPHGFRALIRDSEGNRFALHSNNDV